MFLGVARTELRYVMQTSNKETRRRSVVGKMGSAIGSRTVPGTMEGEPGTGNL